jgi:multiple sugar transport system substrate-binding protein
MKEPPLSHDEIERRLGAMATPAPPVPGSLYGYVRELPKEYPMSASRFRPSLWRPRPRLITAAGAIAAVLVIALGGNLFIQAQKSPPAGLPSGSASSTPTETPPPTASASASGPKTRVVWFIGLGAGSQPNQLQAETDFRARYNATNTDNISLELSIISGGAADDTPDKELARNGGADIVGPIGIQTRAGLPDRFLPLDDLIAQNKTDLSAYPPAALKAFKNPAGQYESLPYIEYPAFIFYNKDLFKAAGLPDLPTQIGEQYMGQDWTWDELATIAKQLTIDATGKKSTDPAFYAAKIRDYGFDTQWINELRRLATPWGAGSYVATDGKTAQIPAVWEQAWKWYYDAMWTSHFAPNDAERSAADLGAGTTIATGRVAMELAWSWGISSFGPHDANYAPTPAPYKHWDIGVLPSNDGLTTDPVDADSFVIIKTSKNPGAAYKTMLAIMADPSLMALYGGMPVNPSQQAAYFKTQQAAVDAQFADNPVTWSVLTEMAEYAASPTHQDPYPNYVQGTTDDQAFYARLQSKGGLNLDAEIAKFKATLQADFKAAP